MATSDELAEVRRNTDEPEDSRFGPRDLALLIDGAGVLRASAIVWRWKAAEYAKMVDVSEAGSSHALSDLFDNAMKMADKYSSLAASEESSSDSAGGRAKVHVIDRA